MVKFALLMYMSKFRQSFVVLIIGNSKSFHLGAQSTFNPDARPLRSASGEARRGRRGLHRQARGPHDPEHGLRAGRREAARLGLLGRMEDAHRAGQGAATRAAGVCVCVYVYI